MTIHLLLYDGLSQVDSFQGRRTLCIDVLNVFLAKINMHDQKDFEAFMNCNKKYRKFVVVFNSDEIECLNPSKCSKDYVKEFKGVCKCNVTVYNIRPYTFEILGALQPFFEIIAQSCLPF